LAVPQPETCRFGGAGCIHKLTVALGIAAFRAGALDAPGQADQSACGKSGENSPHSKDRVR